MRVEEIEPTLEGWRERARVLLSEGVPPEEVIWEHRGGSDGGNLFGGGEPGSGALSRVPEIRVSRGFLSTAKLVACHRGTERWGLLYAALFRMVAGGERTLMERGADPLVRRLGRMAKAVGRDRHKMKAFVRFRKVGDDPVSERERFVAWFEPEHEIVVLTADFFAKRFASMDWSILTPDRCAHWDGSTLGFTEGVERSAAPQGDELEEFWLTYYASIFNPARVKLGAMRAEMPKKYWKNLPEATLIPELTAGAPGRIREMVERGVNLERGHVSEKRPAGAPADGVRGRAITAPERLLERAGDLSQAEWSDALDCCRACPLWEGATQVVGGEGNKDAEVMLVGEQPGDEEDVAGRVFVGPAGRLLNEALEAAGLCRRDLYLTNAVKHFKWKPSPRGKRRLHDKASAGEVSRCRPWLLAEIVRLRPRVIVTLGATAAGSLLGRSVAIGKERGWVDGAPEGLGARLLITAHPSSVLRAVSPGDRQRGFDRLVADLRLVRSGGGENWSV